MPSSFCQLCGKPLTERVHVFRHPLWTAGQALRICTSCYRHNPRCESCGIPIAFPRPVVGPSGLLASMNPDTFCPTCQLHQPKCLTCGGPLVGTHILVEGVGSFCMKCYRSRPPCDICGAPLSDEKWQLSDGRLSCAHCHSTAVDTPAEAGPIYAEIRQIVEDLYGLCLNIPTGLALVDRNQLAQILLQQQPEADEPLDPVRTLGVYVRKGIKRGIYVQSGLPERLLIRVAAHEYAHAWQGENCPLLRDPLLREGFAEWLAYRVLCYYRLERQMARMLERKDYTDVYCQGLRAVLDLEKQVGAAGVIEHCRTSGRGGAANGMHAPSIDALAQASMTAERKVLTDV